MTAKELEARSHEWLRDARLLHEAGRFESAVYLCGYAVEFALKARMCRHLNWPSYRDDLPGMKTHNLRNLIGSTGISSNPFDTEWNGIANWTPESRYAGIRDISESKSLEIIDAAQAVLEAIL